MTPRPATIALSLLPHIGGKTFHALMQAFNHDADAILRAEEADLRRVRGVGTKIAASIRAINTDDLLPRMEAWQKAKINILTWEDAGYPPRLNLLEDAPPVLFVRGRVPDSALVVAVVGTRHPDAISKKRAESIGVEVVQKGGLVVSGLARGVDASAHLGALAIPDGRTVAVLGNGILNPYPAENTTLVQAMLDRGGGLVCECAPDAPPSAPALVARNRIITGLSDTVVIVQTNIDGGAMHAARFALAQGRSLWVCEHEAGGNRALLADGGRGQLLDDDFKSLA